MKIFFSHGSQDKPLIRELCSHLPSHIQGWVDEDKLLIGDELENSLRSAINEDSDFVVIFINENSVKSEWVKKEFQWALECEKRIKRKIILPILLDKKSWQKLEPEFQKRIYIECHDFTRNGVKKLADDLKEHLFSIIDRQSTIEKKEDLSPTLSEKDLSGKPILCFDVDGTLLRPEETSLASNGPKKFINFFHDFITNGYHIAIITGNDFYYQKQRILDPIINAGIAEDITFFSDGGSRLFEYKGNNQFEEVYSYSEDAKIDKEDVRKVNNIFEKLLQNFLLKDSSKTLIRPDIKEIERSYDKYGALRTLKLALFAKRNPGSS